MFILENIDYVKEQAAEKAQNKKKKTQKVRL